MTFNDVMTEASRWHNKMENARLYYDYNINLFFMIQDYQRIRNAMAEYEEASKLSAMLYALARTMR